MPSPWHFWIDVGGTFTDCIARRPDGTLVRHKLLSSEDAPVLAIRHLLGLRRDESIPPVVLRLGTTRGTNALITRSGARTALVTTRGFGDLLHIGYQNRPKLFDLNIRKPTPLFAAVIEIDERIAADGAVLKPLDSRAVGAQLAALKQTGVESLAICLMHASEHPAHEQLVAEMARDIGFTEISVSHEVASIAKIVPRGDTTVMDAYLNPVLRSYVDALGRSLPESDLRALTSSGGLVAAERFRGKDSILSGPAGGVVGYARVAQAAGYQRAIGFDMGGTSTDVSRFDGRMELEYEMEKSGVRVAAPMLAIETVAAGGGSICRFDGVKLVVGPESAGADPGPACYGRGGPLAITDVNLFLGRIDAKRFPFPLDRPAAELRLQAVADNIAATGQPMSLVELADGFVQVANANMAKALRSISVAKGCDPWEYVLVPFGGAAGQHACALAADLGIREILFHPDAGLLSALGAGLADHARQRSAGIYQRLDALSPAQVAETFAALEEQARSDLAADLPYEPNIEARTEVNHALDLRYIGVDAALTIPSPGDGNYAAAFEREHERHYGYVQRGRAIEVVTARVEAVLPSSTRLDASRHVPGDVIPAQRTQTVYFDGAPHATSVFPSDELNAGDRIVGPAIVVQLHSTVVLEPGWEAEVLSGGELIATPSTWASRSETRNRASESHVNERLAQVEADPVQLEIFNNHFAGIAEQMGIALRNTAVSVNVKERLDFSCAIFTARGELVVNAPHVPVHLGAMSETVRHIIADNSTMQAGDVFVSNDPYRGGSHLPDVTVITPVFAADSFSLWERAGERGAHGNAPSHIPPPYPLPQGEGLYATRPLLFFTASRAHHAEIGGITPGSMPPFSRNLAEEGVLIRNFKLIDAGRPQFEELQALLDSRPYPSRAVEDNLADVAAQVAANHQGAVQLLSLVERYGRETVAAYMAHLQQAAEQKLRLALARFSPGRYAFTDHLDDGSPISAALEMSPEQVTIDFTGTGPVLASNLNANPAITKAAIMYVLRTLIDEDIPLNEGVMAAVRIVLPECLLNPPHRDDPAKCAAVAGGNVETSQRVVDVLLGALGVAAASQGTMNNLVFGDATFGYYETICGGAGATADSPGADAVHTHMTNTRLTDPEVLERRFPVRLLEFSIRRGSGGAGLHRGGDGVVRRIEFLKPLTVSIVSQRRGPYRPYGMHGGAPGARGRNILARTDDSIEQLGSSAQFTVQPGDVLTIETPGGGGWRVVLP